MKRNGRTLTVVFLVLALAFSGCKNQNLEFSISAGVEGMDPYSAPGEGILGSEWVASDTLQVTAYVKTFCGGVTITGDYSVEGDNLVLTYHLDTPGAVTSCKGVFLLIYKISHLPQQDYSITIVQDG